MFDLKKIINIPLVLVFIVFFSCIDKNKDFGFVSDAQLIAPIAYGSFNLGDIISGFNDDSIVHEGINNDLSFLYSHRKIAKFIFADFINFPDSIQFSNKKQLLGNFTLKPYTYYESITIGDLKERLPNHPLITELSVSETEIFPQIVIEEFDSEQLDFIINDFNFIHYGRFVSGYINCYLRNSFPTNCKATFQIFDANGSFVDEISYGTTNPLGQNTQATELRIIDLKGKKIYAPLSYKLISLILFETKQPVFIRSYDGLILSFELTDMIIDEGIFNPEDLNYQSPTEHVQININDTLKFKRALIESGFISVNLNRSFIPTGKLIIHFPKIYQNGVPLSLDIPLYSNKQTSIEFYVRDIEMLLSDDIHPFNNIEYYFEFVHNESEEELEFFSTDWFTYDLCLKDYIFKYFEGDFGNYKIDLSKEGFDINQKLFNDISGEIVGENPVMKLSFRNPFGFPVLFEMSIDAFNEIGESSALFINPNILPYPNDISEIPVESEIEFNSLNSSLREFLNLPPNGSINFNATIEINPKGLSAHDFSNFVFFYDSLEIDLFVEIPLLLSGEFFNFSDTIALQASKFDQLIETAEITFQTNNTIPIQIDLTVTPYDSFSKKITGDELFVTILEAAKVDEFGNVLEATHAENRLMIDSKAINSIKIANSLIINALFISPKDGKSPAKLKSEYGFDLNMILDVNPKYR